MVTALIAVVLRFSLSFWADGDAAPGKRRFGVSLLLPHYRADTTPPIPPCRCSPGITRVTVVLPMSSCAVACLGTEGGAVYFLSLPALVLLEDKTLFPDEVLQR